MKNRYLILFVLFSFTLYGYAGNGEEEENNPVSNAPEQVPYAVDCNSSFNAGTAIAQNPSLINTYLYTPATYGYFQTAADNYPANYRTIVSGRNATYNAYREIVLNTGFTVEAGATLQLNIVTCPN